MPALSDAWQQLEGAKYTNVKDCVFLERVKCVKCHTNMKGVDVDLHNHKLLIILITKDGLIESIKI